MGFHKGNLHNERDHCVPARFHFVAQQFFAPSGKLECWLIEICGSPMQHDTRLLFMAVTRLHPQEHSPLKNALFVLLIVSGNTVGNLLLAIGMNRMPGLLAVSFLDYLQEAASSGSLIAGTFLVTLSMVAQLYMYTWADLSYVLPITASGYLVTAVLSKYFLQEHVSMYRWLGVVLISFGVLFVARTPSDTKHLESVPQ